LKAELGEVIGLLCSTLVLQGDLPDQSEIRGINRDGVDGGVNRIIADAQVNVTFSLIVPGVNIRPGVAF